jgi:hypothetical protein
MLKPGHLLPALDPVARPKKLMNVHFAPARAATHYLFKDVANPKAKRIRLDKFYRRTHGERVALIPEILAKPDLITLSKRRFDDEWSGEAYLYSAATLHGERFIVVVKSVKGKYYFVTAYDADLTDPVDRRRWQEVCIGSKTLWSG